MLKQFAQMSQTAGARADYVQGGGGNTSVKLKGGLMAIKASGFRLRQVTDTGGFAVVETATLRDVTAEQGYEPLRPSVEVGFHALLRTFVVHTHPVYVCMALCCQNGSEAIEQVMSALPYGWIELPYINPGPDLCAAMKEKLQDDTQVVFLQNHGLIVTSDDMEECLRIHDEVNNAFAAFYGVTPEQFEKYRESMDNLLYPDQMVYLTLTDVQKEINAAVTFIQHTLLQKGLVPRSMSEAARSFISGWEGESYRKRILS